MEYKHVFFDLDGTIWDFEANSYETLLDLCSRYSLDKKGVLDYEKFIKTYKEHNARLWALYNVDKISQKDLRRERFQRTLADFGIHNFKLSEDIGEKYVEICPRKNKLFPHAFEVLDYLQDKYTLHIITNGFHKTQHIKLNNSNLKPYFNQIITSEKTGVKKPSPLIFSHALNLANTDNNESVYIGDNLEIDILACQNFGIDGIYFNPKNRVHNQNVKFEISCLSQLMKIL
tara:strand:- start:1345 stop:2037 length:693 start_codon:yes stop_codon:yes gene_type:complete